MNSYNAFLTLSLIVAIGLVIQPYVEKLINEKKKKMKR